MQVNTETMATEEGDEGSGVSGWPTCFQVRVQAPKPRLQATRPRLRSLAVL